MKGQILDYSIQSNSGVISGDDQNRYQFSGSAWRGQNAPVRGQKVDFTIDATGQANEIYVLSSTSLLYFLLKWEIKIELLRQFLHSFWVVLVYTNFI